MRLCANPDCALPIDDSDDDFGTDPVIVNGLPYCSRSCAQDAGELADDRDIPIDWTPDDSVPVPVDWALARRWRRNGRC